MTEGDLLNLTTLTPGIETVDDALTALTGCGITCQLGYEEEVGWFWRTIAFASFFIPIGSKTLKLAVESVDDIAVLGKLGIYEKVGKMIGADYWYVKNWDALPDKWAPNKEFLDNAVERGKRFLIAVDETVDLELERIKESGLGKEINYLITEHGYSLEKIDEWWWMVPAGE